MMAMLGPWPNLDEDDVRAEGNAARVAQAASVPAASGADASMRGVQQVYRGEGGASAAQAHWARTGADGGHLAQAGNAMKLAPAVLDAGASVVSAVKVAAGTQAISTTVAVYKALAFGGAFGVTYATARTLMARKAVGKILHEGGEGTGKVIAPIIRRRITEPMRRVLDNLRRPGGPGGTPALAGAGGRNLPLRPAGHGAPTGPRSVQDGMANMGRNNRRGRDTGGGRGYNSRHAEERKEQRDISDSDVNRTLSEGSKKPGKTPGTSEYEGKDGVVVIRNNNTFKIVTVFRRDRKRG
ncbi:DUF4258 domain-containing protein [Nonomuraea angiospora]